MFRARLPITIVLVSFLTSAASPPSGGEPAAQRSDQGGTPLWKTAYDGTAGDYDQPYSLGVSPDGTTVYVTGQSLGQETAYDYATVAYDVTSGRPLWSARYNGPSDTSDIPFALAVSPDGARVYVTGESYVANSEYATVAYDAATGSQVWVARYSGPGLSSAAVAVAVSPDGATVFVTGWSQGFGSFVDFVTVAYDAASGAERWVARYDSNRDDVPRSIGVSPDGTRVFVTGLSTRTVNNEDWLTVAYDATTGATLWGDRYDDPANGYDDAASLAVAPDGSAVFVTGRTYGVLDDYTTVAYDVETGARSWVAHYDGPAHGLDIPFAIGASPDGTRVYVTGLSYRSGEADDDYATITYDAATGEQVWVARFTAGSGSAEALAVSPDGTRIYVTGSIRASGNDEYGTLAYDAANGTLLWGAHYKGSKPGFDDAYALGVSPDGRLVFVTGRSQGPTHNYDFVTIAYGA